MLLFESMEAQEQPANVATAFSDFMRGKNDAALWKLPEADTPRHPLLDDIAEVVKAYRAEILEERASAHSVEDIPQYVMDLTSTTLPILLRSFADRNEVQYRVTLDDS